MKRLWRAIRSRVGGLGHRSRYEREMMEEFRFHIEQETLDNQRRGMSPEEARRAAVVAFGDIEPPRGRLREPRGTRLLDDLAQDLAHALRSIRRSPRVVAVISVTIGLAVGMTAAAWSLVDQLLLRPPPYARPGELVLVFGRSATSPDRLGTSWADFWDLRQRLEAFDTMAVFENGYETPVVLPGGTPAILVEGSIGAGFLDVFGVGPAFGRAFAFEEHRDRASVIMISHSLWVNRFGGGSEVLARSIGVGGQLRRIVGVLPEGLAYPEGVDFVVPQREGPPTPEEDADQDGFGRGWRAHWVAARLSDGVTRVDANRELDRAAALLREEHPATNEGHALEAVPLVGASTDSYRPALYSLLAAVAVILLIACVNVTGLLLSRGLRRQGEVAVRLSLGGGRLRIARQLLIESWLHAVAGAAIGVSVAWTALEVFLPLVPVSIPGLTEATLDWRTAAAVTALATFVASVAGLVPAFRIRDFDVAAAIRTSGPGGTATARARRVQAGLIVGQVGLSTVLLLAAGVLGASFARLLSVDPGFHDPERVLSVRISVRAPKYTPWEGFRRFFTEVEQRVRDLPGVEDAGLSFINPMEPGRAFPVGFEIEGVLEADTPADRPLAAIWPVSSGLFRAVGIPMMRGRAFTDADRKDAPGVVIVNEAFVRRYLPNADPLGLTLRKTQFWDESYPATHEIVGVARDVRADGFRAAPYPVMYFPYDQTPFGNMRVMLRARGEAVDLAAGLREAIWAVDPDIPLERMQSLDRFVSRTVSGERFALWLVGTFGAVALTMSAIGLFGVLSHAVGSRTREFGIRRALGARQSAIIAGVLRRSMGICLVGWMIGMVVFVAITPLVSGLLFETDLREPLAHGGVLMVLMGLALLVGLGPARRAAMVEPRVALRET